MTRFIFEGSDSVGVVANISLLKQYIPTSMVSLGNQHGKVTPLSILLDKHIMSSTEGCLMSNPPCKCIGTPVAIS